jgi:hypothetical protein
MAYAEPLTDEEIEGRLGELDGWSRNGDEITKTFAHTYHECVHLAVCDSQGPRGQVRLAGQGSSRGLSPPARPPTRRKGAPASTARIRPPW